MTTEQVIALISTILGSVFLYQWRMTSASTKANSTAIQNVVASNTELRCEVSRLQEIKQDLEKSHDQLDKKIDKLEASISEQRLNHDLEIKRIQANMDEKCSELNQQIALLKKENIELREKLATYEKKNNQ